MAGDWRVRPGRLWAVGVTTTVIAALAAIVAWLIGEAILDEPILVQGSSGDVEELTAAPILLIVGIAGLAATLLMHLLLAYVPNGDAYFFTIGTLVLLVSFLAIIPLDVSTANKLWLGVMHITVYAFIVPGLAGAVPRVATKVPREGPAEAA